ncbi:MAG: hypothetical protein KAZ85_03795 [Gammaproteobacteria bacterium]|nr:hypothetical protein [Gammaproteobacteria bacterium]
MNEPEEMSEKTQSSVIGMLAAMLAGLIISTILLTPVFFLPADQGLLVGWIILFMILLMIGKNHRLEIGLFYPFTALLYLGVAQTTLHSTLWPYVLVEKIWSVIVLAFVAFIMMSVVILLIAFLFGKR